MSLIQNRNPGNAVNYDIDDSYAVSWVNTANALTSNNFYASASFADYGEEEATGRGPSHYLRLYNCAFTLPDNAVIDGIRVVVERYGVGEVDDYSVVLTYMPNPDDTGGDSTLEVTNPGKQKIGYWPSSDGTTVYGGESDVWNRTWLPAEINDSDFGFAISAEGVIENLDSAQIDSVSMRVYYHGGEEADATGGAKSGDVTTANSATFNVVLSGASALAGGHASIFYPNIAAQGGVGLGGAADIPADTIFMLGGVGVSGVAETGNDVPVGGGIALGGSADVGQIFNPYMEPGRLYVSGQAVAHDFIGVIGVALFGGEANITIDYNPPTAGGAEVYPLSFVNPVWMEGGATYSGEASVDVLYADDEGSGGSLASGEARPTIEVPTEGGIAVSGLADEVCVHIPEISGGMLVNSEAGEHAIITPYWDTTILEGTVFDCGGTSFIDPFLPRGGVGAGGEANYFVGFDPSLKEHEWINTLTGEESVPPQSHDEIGYAICKLDPDTNLFSWDLTYSFVGNARLLTIRGPAEVGENGDLQLRIGNLSGGDFASPVSGSTTLTEDQKNDLIAGLWYWRLQNFEFENLRSQIVVRETVELGGEAVANFDTTAEGGVLASAPPVEKGTYNPPVVTSVTLMSGEAEIGLEPPAAGGVLHGGSADVTSIYNRATSGGALVYGDADEGISYTAFANGGALVNGTSSIGIGPAVSGGILAGGDHDRSFIGTFFPTGGALAAPNHFQQFTDYIIAEGGARAGGKTIGENIRTYSKTHLNYGYAMGSENIFTRVTYEHELIPPTDDVTPDWSEDEFRIEHEPGWCDVEEKCEEGTLPKVVQRRQGTHLPPKIGRTSRRDRSIARAAL